MKRSEFQVLSFVLLVITSSLLLGCGTKQITASAPKERMLTQSSERRIFEFLKDYSDQFGNRSSGELTDYISAELKRKWGPEKIHELAYGPKVRGEPVIVSMIETSEATYIRWYRGKLSFEEIQTLPWTHLKVGGPHGFLITNETREIDLRLSSRITPKDPNEN